MDVEDLVVDQNKMLVIMVVVVLMTLQQLPIHLVVEMLVETQLEEAQVIMETVAVAVLAVLEKLVSLKLKQEMVHQV